MNAEGKTRQNILAQIQDLISTLVGDGPGDIQLGYDSLLFFRDGERRPILDSFDAVMILVELERVFNLHIPEQDIALGKFNTISEITEYVYAQLEAVPEMRENSLSA